MDINYRRVLSVLRSETVKLMIESDCKVDSWIILENELRGRGSKVSPHFRNARA